MSRPIPKVPPRFDALLFATQPNAGAPNADIESAVTPGGSGIVKIPIDRYAHLTSWSAFIWDNGQPQTTSAPTQAVIFRLYLERIGVTRHTPAGQTVIATSQQGAADSRQCDILLVPNDVLIASWRGIANQNAVGYCRLLGDYVQL